MLKTCIHKDIYIGYNASYTSVISWEKLSSISFFGRAMISVHPCSGILWIHVHIGLLILLVASGYLYRKSLCCIRGNLPKLSHMPKMQMHLQYTNVQHMHTNILIYEYYLFNTSNSLGFLNKKLVSWSLTEQRETHVVTYLWKPEQKGLISLRKNFSPLTHTFYGLFAT